MQSAVLRSFGGPEVFDLAETPDPRPKPGWSTVQLRSAGLNWHDALVRSGVYSSPLPIIPGADGAGTIVSGAHSGEEVVILPSMFWGGRESAPASDFEILGDHRDGTYAQMTQVPEECLFPKPANLSWAQASAFSLVGVTVFRALFTRGRLRAGESLLVLGASGGVASFAIQLASAAGVKVTATSADEAKRERARSIGAISALDHSDADWTADARAAANDGEGFDLVLDSVGRVTESLECLRPGGRCVVLGASASESLDIPLRPFYFSQREVIGTTMGSPKDMRGLMKLMAEVGTVAPIIDESFGLDQVVAAHQRLESGQGFGKITLTIDS
ncbi:zinc-binding dehydrogenase [Brevibacterium aurantiacum]|uniref:Oxidoreductase n=1 Tax=Brevibacterium aurantiacum TaxID=273384 RepID=A0A4Z0KI68_BREAU|nr:zinc-binding dehydrogenase [Brevibacterium aurantiacum]TGD37029.1 oxidoreductase [Brevibacterium aurantiacum]